MTINGLLLQGWEDLSTWGYDSGLDSYYAQLTRNGNSDDDGPDIWITPPRWPAIPHPDALARVIADATGTDVTTVHTAMDAGLGP